MEQIEKKSFKERLRVSLIWVLFVTLAWYMFVAGFIRLFWEAIMNALQGSISNAMFFTLDIYAATIIDVLVLMFLTNAFSKNRYIWKSFRLPRRKSGADGSQLLTQDDVRAEVYGRSRNGFRMLGVGLLLGFLTNFACILCALIHGDIKLYFDCSVSAIPYFLFSLVSNRLGARRHSLVNSALITLGVSLAFICVYELIYSDAFWLSVAMDFLPTLVAVLIIWGIKEIFKLLSKSYIGV